MDLKPKPGDQTPESAPASARSPGSVAFRVWLLVGLIAFGYAYLIYLRASPFAGGSDSSGYMNSARLLARGEFLVPARSVEGLTPENFDYHIFQPLGFVMNRATGRMAPTYPIGLPLHLLVGAPIVGWEKTARAVNVVSVLAAGVLIYALGRALGLARGWALAGVAFLWASPVFLFHVIQPMSDGLATTWALATIYAAWRARERWRWAFFAGLAFALAVLVRPTNLLLAVPLAIALGFNWRAWLACIVAGLPGAVGLGYYNFRSYESPFTTGYGYLGDAFEWRFLAPNLTHFALWVPLLVSVPVALAALALPWFERRRPVVIALLASWLLVLVGFYATYYCAGETWWYLRFLLPAFPAVIIGGLLVGQTLAARGGLRRRVLVPLGLAAFALAQQMILTHELGFFPRLRDWERDYFYGARYVRDQLPPNSVVVAFQLSGALYYYTDRPIARSDFMWPHDFYPLAQAARAANRPIYAAFYPEEEAEAFGRRLGGKWEKVASASKTNIWKLVEFPSEPPPRPPR